MVYEEKSLCEVEKTDFLFFYKSFHSFNNSYQFHQKQNACSKKMVLWPFFLSLRTTTNERLLLYRLLILLVTVACCQQTLVGQSYAFKHYQVENGLSNNAVICSVQDKAGFLWFGTKDGLNRFDGYNFKVFRNNPDDRGSIGSNFIHSLFVDKTGQLWIGTEKGLYKYNSLSESFSLVPGTNSFQVSEITADAKGSLWCITGLTLFRYVEKTTKLEVFSPEQFFESTSVGISPSGTIWVSTPNGLLKKYIPEQNKFYSYDVFREAKPAASRWIEKIYFKDKDELLVGTGTAGVKLFDTKTGTYKNLPVNEKGKTDLFVRSFLQAAKDEIWIGTEAGIFTYNTYTANVQNLQKKYNDPFSLSDNAVYSFCRDKEGGIWIGTYFGGINYLPQPLTPFAKYIPKIGENSLSGNVVREIRKDKKGNLWIGTEDAGLTKWEAATGKFVHLQPTGENGSISYSNIHGLLLTGNELWIGTFEHGLDVLDINSNKVVRHYSTATQPALKSNFIYCIYQAGSGEILIGTTIGIYLYNRGKDSFEPFPDLPLYNWYTSVVKDANGIIWTGTYGNGVNYLNKSTGVNGNFRYNPNDKNSISSDRVNAIFEDSKKGLWFATENGLCKWNAVERNFKRYNTASGFPSNFMMSMLEDSTGKLWISTTKGLVAFDPATEKLQVYTTDNGLLSDQFNFSSAYKDDKGRMYFGSAKGLVSFLPSDFRQHRFTPPVYITGFQVNNKDMVVNRQGSPLHRAITFTKSVTLQHDQSTFSIDFAALSYTAPEMLEYAYKLEGLSNEWTYLKKNRKAYFTELKPGSYVFKIKASNGSGTWNTGETQLAITILPPWWKSWWAYSLYALALLTGVVYLVRNYHRRMQEKAERNMELLEIAKEKELYHAKMEFFTAVAHEIRTPLTLIKGPLEKIVRKAGHLTEIQPSLRIMDRNTNRLLDLTNQLLDFRQTEINGFSLSFVKTNVSELLEEAYQSFSTLAEQKNIQYRINLPDDSFFAFVDTDAFSKIIYNLFSNALKYADKSVDVSLLPVVAADTVFTLEFRNDGHPIPESLKEKIFEPFYRIKDTDREKGTGIGLALSRSLAQLHQGILEVKSFDGKWNVFLLQLPIHQGIEFTLGGKYRVSKPVTEINGKL